MSIRERRRGRSLPTEEVRFYADHQAWATATDELEQATAAAHAARRRGSTPDDVADRLAAAEQAVQDLTVDVFVVRTLSPDDWDVLIGEHPPVDADDPTAQWNPDTFFPALLAETVTETTEDGPESSSAEDWVAMAKDGEITPGQRNQLINTAVRLNTSVTIVSDAVGKGSAATRS